MLCVSCYVLAIMKLTDLFLIEIHPGAYGSVSAHSDGFAGGRPTGRGLPRGSRGSDSGFRHLPPRTSTEEPEAKRRYAPETRGNYSASRGGGRMPLRGGGRRGGQH